MTAQPQHLVALESANQIRYGIAALKHELHDGAITIVAALEDERAQPMRLSALLNAQLRWGNTRTEKLLRHLKIGGHRRLRELTARQRQLLRDHFDPPAVAPAPPPPPPPPPTGMEPERQDARVLAALLRAPATRTELALRLREMQLRVDDLDAALRRLFVRSAIVVRQADGFELYTVRSLAEELAA